VTKDHENAPTLILAPIRGITDVVYRNAFARCFAGLDRAIAPYIQPRQGHALRPVELRQVAPDRNNTLWTIPQVLANDKETFAAALLDLHEAGHAEVGWNLGCPTPNVAGRGRGSGLLPHPDRIDEILGHVLDATPVQLSVKIRLGYQDPDEHLAVIDVLNRHPLTEVTLHARTGEQMYKGVSDVDRAAQALPLCRHPFVYNGDITDVDGFRALRARLPGAAAWMIGRGALRCPFLPEMLKDDATSPALPPPDVRRRRLREFHDLLFEGYRELVSGPKHLMDKLHVQWTWLAHSFADPLSIQTLIRSSNDPASYVAAVDRVFRQEL
jgi:tRNA-dihydrouridine synthase B